MNELVEAVPTPEKEYRPTNKEALRHRRIEIRFLDRGCIISVGCKEIAFESVDNAMTELNAYVANPYEMQIKWIEILK